MLPKKMYCSSKYAHHTNGLLSQKGFSLIEMLVVLTVVIILAFISIPNYQSFLLQRKIDVVAKSLAQDLEFARTYAQTNNLKTKICPTTPSELNMPLPKCVPQGSLSDWSAWVILALNEAGNISHVLARSHIIDPSILISGTGNSGRIFNQLGKPYNNIGFTMTIAARHLIGLNDKVIVLSPSGKVAHQSKLP